LRQHWLDANRSIPIEWLVILIWNGIGLALWWAASGDRSRLGPGEQERLMTGGTPG
jgi:hypothetical protein